VFARAVPAQAAKGCGGVHAGRGAGTEDTQSAAVRGDGADGPVDELQQRGQRDDGQQHHGQADDEVAARTVGAGHQPERHGVDGGGHGLVCDERGHPPADLGQPGAGALGERAGGGQLPQAGQNHHGAFAEHHQHDLGEQDEQDDELQHDGDQGAGAGVDDEDRAQGVGEALVDGFAGAEGSR
jgi:hypothetical protein